MPRIIFRICLFLASVVMLIAIFVQSNSYPEELVALAISHFSRTSMITIMICSSCRRTILSRLPSRVGRTFQLRHTSSAPSTSPSPRQPSSDVTFKTSKTSPSAISSNSPGISQPLVTPMLPSTSSASSASKPKQPTPAKQQKMVSSIPGGTPLNGLGYLQANPTVLAKEDDEYPEWLWTLLEPESGAASKGFKSATDIAGRPSISPSLLLLHRVLSLTQLRK
jgi:Mitochondrial ribosomal protein L37